MERTRTAGDLDGLFRTLLGRFFSIPARHPATGPVTFAQMRVLWTLEREGSQTLGAMARALGLSRPSVTGLVDRLESARCVRRLPCREDRRRILLELLPRGRRILAEHARCRRERFEKLGRILPPRKVRALAQALETVNTILARWNGDPP